jgi:hypothetical protein
MSQQFISMFTAPLPRNGHPIVPQYISAGTCLLSHCLAVDLARTMWKTILAIPFLLFNAHFCRCLELGLHVTLHFKTFFVKNYNYYCIFRIIWNYSDTDCLKDCAFGGTSVI